MDILTPKQNAKFLDWVGSKDRNLLVELALALSSKLKAHTDGAMEDVDHHDPKTTSMELSPTRHESAILYILNHRLKNHFPKDSPLKISPSTLKRLSRHPYFESLAAVTEEEKHGASSNKNKKTML